MAGIIVAATMAPFAIARLVSSQSLDPWRLGEAQLTLVPGGAAERGQAVPAERPVTLPDAWNKAHPGFGGVGRYRFTVAMASDALGDRALYIPRVSNRCVVEVNGVKITQPTGSDSTPWLWNRPLYLVIPADKLHPGDNDVTVSVTGEVNSRAGLSESFFGPRLPLYNSYRLRWFFQVDLLWIANLSVIVLALPLLFSWLRDPVGSANYGIFSAGAILFGLRNFHGSVDFLPMPVEYWWPLVSASLGWSLGFIWVFLLRFSDHRWPRFEAALAVFTLAGSIALFMVPTSRFMALSPWLWYVPQAAVGLFCVAAFTRRAIAEPTPHRVILMIGVLAQVVPALHDILWIEGAGAFSSMLWMAVSFPLLLVLTSALLADDVARTRAALGGMNRILEARITVARQELESLYESRRRTEREAIGAEERLRLMRDMHDGVGTRLSLLLSGLARGDLSIKEVTHAVQGSLEELHLLLDARGPNTATLMDALANLRYRLEPRLTALGVETRWEIGPGAESLALSAEMTLDVLRIIQECIANSVRHGQAKVVTLKLECPDEVPPRDGQGAAVPPFEVLVIDDGIGIGNAAAATKGGGRGLANIKARADAIGATFTLRSDASGTTARLALGHGSVPGLEAGRVRVGAK
ncbi:sensor histidine kinase [Mesorhizobium comanense]|uniref:sensor histidine kinase n=1 Tax=Mesorhizobium comanense TaxID=2502215 RepID=UPI0010F56A49|nr:ATP-binding protein [Mesorhizobium comanense]